MTLHLKASDALRRVLDNTDLAYDDEVDVLHLIVDDAEATLATLREIVEVEEAVTFHESRAGRAFKTLDYYKQDQLGETGEPDSETLRDFIQDAIHWLASRRNEDGTPYHEDPIYALKEAVRISVNDFPIELKEGE